MTVLLPYKKVDGVNWYNFERELIIQHVQGLFILLHPVYGIRDAQTKLLLFCRWKVVFWKEFVRTNLCEKKIKIGKVNTRHRRQQEMLTWVFCSDELKIIHCSVSPFNAINSFSYMYVYMSNVHSKVLKCTVWKWK